MVERLSAWYLASAVCSFWQERRGEPLPVADVRRLAHWRRERRKRARQRRKFVVQTRSFCGTEKNLVNRQRIFKQAGTTEWSRWAADFGRGYGADPLFVAACFERKERGRRSAVPRDRDPQTEAGTDREAVAPATNRGLSSTRCVEEWRQDEKNLSFFLSF